MTEFLSFLANLTNFATYGEETIQVWISLIALSWNKFYEFLLYLNKKLDLEWN